MSKKHFIQSNVPAPCFRAIARLSAERSALLQDVVRAILSEFFEAAPYDTQERFVWLKGAIGGTNYIKVAVPARLADQIDFALGKYNGFGAWASIGRPNSQPRAGILSGSSVLFTAISWFVTTRMQESERQLLEVLEFVAYLSKHHSTDAPGNPGVDHGAGHDQSDAAPSLPAKFSPRKHAIRAILKTAAGPMTAIEVVAAAKERFPDAKITHLFASSTLSGMKADREISGNVRQSSEPGRKYMEYSLCRAATEGPVQSPLPLVAAPVQAVVPVGRPTVEQGWGQASSPASRNVKVPICAEADLALHILSQQDGAGQDLEPHRAMNRFAKKALVAFMSARPYANPSFFWIKAYIGHKAKYSNNGVYFTLSGEHMAIRDQMDAMKSNRSLIEQGTVMIGGRHSEASQIPAATLCHSAIVWYLATRLTPEQQALPPVAAFLRFAKRNFVMDGRDAVSTYRAIQDAPAPVAPVETQAVGETIMPAAQAEPGVPANVMAVLMTALERESAKIRSDLMGAIEAGFAEIMSTLSKTGATVQVNGASHSHGTLVIGERGPDQNH